MNILDEKTFLNKFECFCYLERYVNDGSPSGFTFKYSCSDRYSPRKGIEEFSLPLVEPKDPKYYGEKQQNMPEELKNSIPIHPDFLKVLKKYDSYRIRQSTFKVVPTSSARTVFARIDGIACFLKLHYDGILCRVNRTLPWRKAIAEVEMSNCIKNLIDEETLPSSFSIMECPFSKTDFHNEEDRQFSFIFRKFKPYPEKKGDPLLIPLFSLFSKDVKNLEDRSILFQILSQSEYPKVILIDNILIPILVSYILMIKKGGVIAEMNAQNLLVELSESLDIERVVFRDLMGIEKDLTIRDNLKLTTHFDSIEYKTIKKENDDYFKRHSFSYDFKLSLYVIEPLLLCFCKYFPYQIDKIRAEVREIAISLWGDFRFDFFNPYDLWYNHPKQLLAKKEQRIYLEHKAPIFR